MSNNRCVGEARISKGGGQFRCMVGSRAGEGCEMKLRLAFIGFLILCQAAVAQNRSNVWVFGRGNVMDFNFDPPALSTTSWAPGLVVPRPGARTDDLLTASQVF